MAKIKVTIQECDRSTALQYVNLLVAPKLSRKKRFFLPPYCSELNQSETQWHQLKAHEIAGRIFDNEYDLAKTIMHAMKNRSQRGGYVLERFMFKST